MKNVKNTWQSVLNSNGHENIEICPDDILYNQLNITELFNLICKVISPFHENISFKYFIRKSCQGIYPVTLLIESTDIIDKCGVFGMIIDNCKFSSNFAYCDITADGVITAEFTFVLSYTIKDGKAQQTAICKFQFMNGHWKNY